MLILEFKGGLGNQMFQYAFYKSLLFYGKNVKCKITNEDEHRLFKLNIFPKVNFECVNDLKYKELLYMHRNRNIMNKIINKLFVKTNHFYYHENERKCIDRTLYEFNDVILSGYFQNELYFKIVEDKIKDEFTFPYGEEKLQELIASLDEKSVSIHIRRGDYLYKPEIYGDICTTDYYSKAIDHIERKIKANYIIFSDDIDWAKRNFNIHNAMYIEKDLFDSYNDWYDMYIMSKCHHNIIANSSFSWWGGWLNRHSDKIVVAPSYFDNRYKYKNIACNSWMTIKV